MSFGNFFGDLAEADITNVSFEDVIQGDTQNNPLKNWKRIYARKVGVGQLDFLLNNYVINPVVSSYATKTKNFLPGTSSLYNFYEEIYTVGTGPSNIPATVTLLLYGNATVTAALNANASILMTRMNARVYCTWSNLSFTIGAVNLAAACCSVYTTALFQVNKAFIPDDQFITSNLNAPNYTSSGSTLWENKTATHLGAALVNMTVNLASATSPTFGCGLNFGLGALSTTYWLNRPGSATQNLGAPTTWAANDVILLHNGTLTYPCVFYKNPFPDVNEP